MADFDIAALYDALDAQRQARGLTWTQTARALSPTSRDPAVPSISASTLTGMRNRGAVEGDGVLQMLRWLGRAPESFMPGATATASLPPSRPDQILRFDTTAIYAALEKRRVERGLTWKQVADQLQGFSVASLKRLSEGGRTAFPHVARIALWLDVPVASFTRAVD